MEECKAFDIENGNEEWMKAHNKEIGTIQIAFKILRGKHEIPEGYTKATGFMIYDIKMDFTKKARWVKAGHLTASTGGSSYAGVVSRELVQIALLYAAMNDLDVTYGDIKSAYLLAPTSEKHYIHLGSEFGEDAGKCALIVRALYGGKHAGRDYWMYLCECMHHLGIESCVSDLDVWYQPSTNKHGDPIYEYVLLYTDDFLAVSNKGMEIIKNDIGKYFTFKKDSICHPNGMNYLGGKLYERKMEGKRCWSFCPTQYVKQAWENVEKQLQKRIHSGDEQFARSGSRNNYLPSSKSALPSDYHPELDNSPELNAVDLVYYQSLIGILRWIVEMGRVDICLETSVMSSCLALPRDDHLRKLFQILVILKLTLTLNLFLILIFPIGGILARKCFRREIGKELLIIKEVMNFSRTAFQKMPLNHWDRAL